MSKSFFLVRRGNAAWYILKVKSYPVLLFCILVKYRKKESTVHESTSPVLVLYYTEVLKYIWSVF